MKDTCGSCGKLILWLAHERTAKVAPIEAEPNPKGNVALLVLADVPGGEPYFVPVDSAAMPAITHYRVLGKKDLERARHDGRTLYVSHFATCKDAIHWRDKEKADG